VYDPGNVLQSQAFPALSVVAPDEVPVYPFLTPLSLNNVTPTRLILAGLNAVYESFDQGETLTQVPGLHSNLFDQPPVIYGVQNAVAYGGFYSGEDTITLNENILYVGSGSQLYQRKGAHPEPLVAVQNYPVAEPAQLIKDIVLQPGDFKTVFVAEESRVLMSTDEGASWTNITGNLATDQLNSLELVGTRGSVLLVGGRQGVHYLNLGALPAALWSPYGSGLPNVPVWDLDFSAGDGILVVATLGRGAWKMQLTPSSGPEFHATPAPGTAFDFGNVSVNTPSALQTIHVDNIGAQALTLGCNFSGSHAADFSVFNCNTLPVSPFSSVNLQVRCYPAALGQRSATLTLSTNDADEPSVQYPMLCNGVPFRPELMFINGFESP
jgi:hypothetical protein